MDEQARRRFARWRPEHRPGGEVAADRDEVASAECDGGQLARVAHTHHVPAESGAVKSAGRFDSRRDYGVRHRVGHEQPEYLVQVSVVENPHGIAAPKRGADGGHAKRGYRPRAPRGVRNRHDRPDGSGGTNG